MKIIDHHMQYKWDNKIRKTFIKICFSNVERALWLKLHPILNLGILGELYMLKYNKII